MYAEEAIEIGLSIKQLWMLGYNPLLYAAEIVPIHRASKKGNMRDGASGVDSNSRLLCLWFLCQNKKYAT